MSTRGKSLLNSFENLLLEAPRDQALRMLWDQRLDEVRTLQYSLVKYTAVQYSTVQYSTVQYSAV